MASSLTLSTPSSNTILPSLLHLGSSATAASAVALSCSCILRPNDQFKYLASQLKTMTNNSSGTMMPWKTSSLIPSIPLVKRLVIKFDLKLLVSIPSQRQLKRRRPDVILVIDSALSTNEHAFTPRALVEAHENLQKRNGKAATGRPLSQMSRVTSISLAMVQAHGVSPPCKSLTPELRSRLAARTNLLLLRIVRANRNTQYASKTTSLAGFRDAISAYGTDSEKGLLEAFQTHVPLSDYESYRPLVSKFNQRPCEENEVVNLFAPGLPNFLAISSATSGNEPKIFAKYQSRSRGLSFGIQGSVAAIFYYGYKEIKEVERESDQIMKRIPVCIGSGGMMREMQGWNVDDDDERMPLLLPEYVAPWAASMIKHLRSFLMIHALFTLARHDVHCISTTFSTVFFDLIRYMDEEWDMFVSCIREGTVPALEGVDEVRPYLQAHCHPNPERAAELLQIGPPFSRVGWAAHVWPKLRIITAVWSGPFATVLPKVKSILGPTIDIRSLAYGSSESFIAGPYADSLELFALRSHDLVEFLDVTSEELHENLCQACDLVVGKQYEVILTTNDGLWRYRLGDVIDVVGFDANDGAPVFAYSGRRSSTIRFPHTLISDTQLVAAVQAISSDIQVHEFTTMVDDRYTPPTVGFFFEVTGALGPNTHLVPQILFDGLVATNIEHQEALSNGRIRLPTIRILKPGTFMEYRQWMSSKLNVGAGQTKVPIIMLKDASREWILERVVREL